MLDEDQILQYLHGNVAYRRGMAECSKEKKVSKQIRERRKFGVVANLSCSRYELVRKVIHEAGFTISDKEDLSEAFLIWTDNFLPIEKIMRLKTHQRVNHFPGMIEICRKDFLAKNFMRMNRVKPGDYNFVPKTWVLPQEHGLFLNYVRRTANAGIKSSFIMKPANGAMGHGIRLYRSGENVPANPSNGTPCVLQEYIQNPLLIDGYKCDLRVYVLVTSCDPLRVFIYNEGLVRLSSEKYVKPNEPNGESMYMHLTNYAVNKRHADYVKSASEMEGSKRSFGFLDQYLRDTRQVDPNTVWRSIRDLIVKTMTLAAPHLLHSYRMCRRGRSRPLRTHCSLECLTQSHDQSNKGKISLVRCDTAMSRESGDPAITIAARGMKSKTETRRRSVTSRSSSVPFFQSSFFEILGFDILIDSELKPWLIEVNRSPSFNGDQELDRRVKQGLLRDALHLLNIRYVDKLNTEKEQKLFSVNRLYRSVTPSLTPGWMRGNSLDRAVKSSSGKSCLPVVQPFAFTRSPQLDFKLAREVNKLHLQLLFVRRRMALEFFEYHNSGNWCLIFPTDDRTAQKRFASLILANFSQFHNGKVGDWQNELEETYLRPLTEEDIMERLNKLLGNAGEGSVCFKEVFSQDSDYHQLDNYDVTSSEDSSDNDVNAVSSQRPTIQKGLLDLSCSLTDYSSVISKHERSRLSPLKHLLSRNIRSYREQRKPENVHSVTLPRNDFVSVPWRI